MKREDLKKHLDDIIIDGLIKEAEQDNADFEAAIRQMSKSDFLSLINESAYQEDGPTFSSVFESNDLSCRFKSLLDDSDDEEFEMDDRIVSNSHLDFSYGLRCENNEECLLPKPKGLRRSSEPKAECAGALRSWIEAVAAVEVILAAVAQCIETMDAKLCESALYASEPYIASSAGAAAICCMDERELKQKLPELESVYEACAGKNSGSECDVDELCEAGWHLAVACLNLHRKAEAIKVLELLSERFESAPLGRHCRKLLEQL